MPPMHSKGRDHKGGPRGGWVGGWRRFPKRLGGGYCRLQMPLRLDFGVRETVAGHRLGALYGTDTLPARSTGTVPRHRQALNVNRH